MKYSYSGPKLHFDFTHNRLHFTLLVVVVTLIFVNLSLNLYILKILRINGAGFNHGNFSVYPHGLYIQDFARIESRLQAKSVQRSNSLDSLHLSSYSKIQIVSPSGRNYIQFDDKKLEIQANRLSIVEQSNQDKSSDTIRAMHFDGDSLITQNLNGLFDKEKSGLRLSDSLQTGKLTGSYNQDLGVEALLKDVRFSSKQDGELHTKYGSIDIESAQQITLDTLKHIEMNSPRINIRNLPYLNEAADVFDESIAGQVCVCSNGQLFFSDSNGLCRSSMESCNQ